MGAIECCQNQDTKKNNHGQIQFDPTFKNNTFDIIHKITQENQLQKQRLEKQKLKNNKFIDFDLNQGIPQYIGVRLQNLSQLHTFFKNISHEGHQKNKGNQQNLNNYGGFYIPQTQKQYVNIIQQVKSGIFELRNKTKKKLKALQINDTVKLNKKVQINKINPKSQWNTLQNKRKYSNIVDYGYQFSQQSIPKTPKNRKSQSKSNLLGYDVNLGYSTDESLNRTLLQQTPYFIPWLLLDSSHIAVYVGQWKFENIHLHQNLPYGIGRLYIGGKWILQGFIQTVLRQQQHMKLFEQQKIVIFGNQQKKIQSSTSKKIQFLRLNFQILLNGQGRKFNQVEEYIGQFVKGKLHCNNGIYRNFQLQYEYQGKFINGIKTGKGNQKTKLTYYQGNFQDDKKNGYGTLMFYISTRQQRQRQLQQQKILQKNQQNDPDYIQIKQRIQKQLELQRASNKILRTLLKNNIQNYQGDYLFTFESTMNTSLKHNLKLQQNSKTLFLEKYIGQFQIDKFHGKGTYQWSNGNYYIGDWKDGKMDGVGEFYWKQGFYYIGQYKNDLKHGKGQMTWDPYRRYRGTWAFGQKHGYGQEIRIELGNQQKLNIVITSCLWKNNIKSEPIYWQKCIQLDWQYSDASLLLVKHIEFYYSQQQLLSEQQKIELQALKYYEKPCQICQQYFLKRPTKKKVKLSDQNKDKVDGYTPQILTKFVSKINQSQNNTKFKNNGIQIFGKQIKQPSLCKDCQQKTNDGQKIVTQTT